jgi:hypothetical protein
MRELKGDWRDLFNGFMVALDLRKCFLAFCGIVMTLLFCGIVTIAVGISIDAQGVQWPEDLVLHKWWQAECKAWHAIYTGNVYTEKEGKLEKIPGGKFKSSLTVKTVQRGGKPLVALAYSAGFVLVFVGIWAYFGGAICRIAAYEIAKDGERIETRKAIQFARKKFWSFYWAPLICVIGFLFFAFCNFAGGLVGKVLDYLFIGSTLTTLLLPLAILSGFIMTLITVGTLAGAPLFAPAVAAEGTDSFDAVSRGFSYVYSRPWHYLGYQLVSSAYGYVCIAFVILFAITMCHLGIQAGSAGFELFGVWDKGDFGDITNASWKTVLSGDHRSMERYGWDPVSIVKAPHPYGRLQTLSNQIVGIEHDGASLADLPWKRGHRLAGFFTTLWLVLTLGMALGYVVSYFFSQQTIIYLVLRKKVDGIEMNEVFEEAEEEAKALEVPKPGDASKAPEVPKAADASKPADAPPAAEPKPPESPKEGPK